MANDAINERLWKSNLASIKSGLPAIQLSASNVHRIEISRPGRLSYIELHPEGRQDDEPEVKGLVIMRKRLFPKPEK